MGFGNSKFEDLEKRNASLCRVIDELKEKLNRSEMDVLMIKKDHENTKRQLNETRDNLCREQANLLRREIEVESLRMSGVELSQVVAMTNQIAEDRQRLMDKKEQVDKEIQAALQQQEQLLNKMSEEAAKDKKKLIDTITDLTNNQVEIKRFQETMHAQQSVKKLMNLVKSTMKIIKLHAKNPLKRMKELEILQRDLDKQITEVKSFMDEGYLTKEALNAFAGAAVLNTQLLEFLVLHNEVDEHALGVAIEAHQEEWQELISARRRFFPLTDQQIPEIENIFYDRFRSATNPINQGLPSSASFAAASVCPADLFQPSSEPELAAELEGLTVDEVSSTLSASEGGNKGRSQEERGNQLLEELCQRAANLTTALDEGLLCGRFVREGNASGDQATAAALDDFPSTSRGHI